MRKGIANRTRILDQKAPSRTQGSPSPEVVYVPRLVVGRQPILDHVPKSSFMKGGGKKFDRLV